MDSTAFLIENLIDGEGRVFSEDAYFACSNRACRHVGQSHSMKSLALILLALAIPALAADKPKKNKGEDKKAGSLPYKVGEFIEPDFPFFSSVLDCRDLGEGFPKDNLTPRGLILNLGHNLWACFDVDLLRIACIWESEPGKPPITLNALAPRSYQDPGQKTKDGQDDLPKPLGKVWLANGLYPGWQLGEKPSFTDPRPAGVDAKEIGRGQMSGEKGRLISVALNGKSGGQRGGVLLTYLVNGTLIEEQLSAARSGGGIDLYRPSQDRSERDRLKLVRRLWYRQRSW